MCTYTETEHEVRGIFIYMCIYIVYILYIRPRFPCIYICVCVCVYIYIHAYIHIYTETEDEVGGIFCLKFVDYCYIVCVCVCVCVRACVCVPFAFGTQKLCA
jgi:hypothetical protein